MHSLSGWGFLRHLGGLDKEGTLGATGMGGALRSSGMTWSPTILDLGLCPRPEGPELRYLKTS